MLYVVLFTDRPGHGEVRQRLMQSPLAFLEQHQAAIRTAGPLRGAEDGADAGGLWLVEAENPAAVRELIRRDPFWPTGLRESVRILEWRQVFAEGRRRTPAQ